MTADLASLIDPAATLTKIGSGYQFTEGPVWAPEQNCLLFSDIPGDSRWRWTRAEGMKLDLFPTFKGNGMALDNDGHLIVCEQMSSCRVRFVDGKRERHTLFLMTSTTAHMIETIVGPAPLPPF